MSLENENGKPVRPVTDVRVFVIALLTTVIVLGVYHFGMGLCRMYCNDGPGSCGPCGARAPRGGELYVLMPARDAMSCNGERRFHGGKKFRDRAGDSRNFAADRFDNSRRRQGKCFAGVCDANRKARPQQAPEVLPETPAEAPAEK